MFTALRNSCYTNITPVLQKDENVKFTKTLETIHLSAFFYVLEEPLCEEKT